VLVQDFLQHSADRLPDKVALICDNHRLTYREVDLAANRLANALHAAGVGRGDRVAIYLPNSAAAVVAIFAALKAGGVFVVINASTKPDKLVSILNNCRAAALITAGRDQPTLRHVFASVPSLQLVTLTKPLPADPAVLAREAGSAARIVAYDQVQCDASPERPPQVNIDLDLACLIYTSGSTGEPKGVMSDHSNVIFAAGAIISYIGNLESDIVIDVLPLSFDYGLYQLLMVFKFGGTLVLERSFAFPAAILKRMQDEGVTGFPGVPTLFAMLLKMDISEFDLSRLRYLTNTAAALPPSHILALRQKFPWATLFSMYGLTETKRTLYLPPDQLDIRPDSVGVPIPGTECWVADENGTRLPPGSTGELVVRGRHVMRGYWEDEAMSSQRYRAGEITGERLCFTGDLFRVDTEGYFYFVGRKDDIIKTRGEKVAPKEVEAILYRLPGIAEAAVVGVPDPVLGEAVKAVVVADRSHLSEADILAHCRANLEDFMVPQQVEIRDELPKTPSGKIDKKTLK